MTGSGLPDGVTARTGPEFDAGDRVRAAEVAALFKNVTIGVVGASGAAVALALALVRLGSLSVATALAWVGVIIACAAAHIALRLAYGRRGDRAGWRSWAILFTAIALVEGIGWGWASVGLVGGDRLDLRLLAFVVCFGVAAGSVPAFGSFLPAFLCLFVPATVPELVWSVRLIAGSPQEALFAMLSVVFILAMGGLGLRFNADFHEILGLQIRAGDLAADLRRQKDVAEEANLAKSTFLAAASHDLRQPVHALSLFVGALRNVALPPEALRLVEHIEASTLALDGLFGALLDISRLDAGIVEVERRTVPIGDLIGRICGDHAGEAEAKSLSVRALPCSALVHTDPVLMERIVRNLVVNAIRHTAGGRVVVGCRRRGGLVWVEVRDNGRGIAPEQQQRIFQEYVQLDNPERDRVKGLGLGLAIVRRLCALLDCPLDLWSVPGRGSCFRVAMPLAAGRPAAALRPPTSSEALARGHGLIVVVDDEPAIQEGMARVLGGWGYGTLVAGSGRELLTKLATCPAVPVLIICDYRLRDGETGSALIEQLQSEYNAVIPAILITGDTAPDRLAEARASGFLLLHKPVPNGKLRAAISNLIAASQAGHPEAAVEADPVR